MGEFESSGKGASGTQAKKSSSLWDSLKTIGRGALEGLTASRQDPMQGERRAAAAQVHRSLKAWRDRDNAEAIQRKPQIPSGGGIPLPGPVKSKMEGKLGADLSAVKVHTGGDSEKASEDLNARAFTVGDDVHFGGGQFDPSSKDGEKLLAHELTHVVQGQRGGVQRKEESEGADTEGADGEAMEVSDPDEPAEKEADAVSEKVVEDKPDEKSPSVAAKLKGVFRKIFRVGDDKKAPFDEAAVKTALGAQGCKADRGVENLKKSPVGAQVAALVLAGTFKACKGYNMLIREIGSTPQTAGNVLPALTEAQRLKDMSFGVVFEDKNDAAGYDIDVAGIDPKTGAVKKAMQCKQAEAFTESALKNNLKKAAGQLTKAPGEQKWAVIYFPNGKVADLEKEPFKTIISSFAGAGPTKIRIVMPDGAKEY